MTSIKSLPPEVLEEIYLSIPRSLLHSEIIEALAIDEAKRLQLEGHSVQQLKEMSNSYRSRLQSMGPISLAELAYETCVLNNTFDRESNLAWLDREGKFKINPNDLYRHHFVDSVFAMAEKSQGFEITLHERKRILSQLEGVCKDGSGSVSISYGDVVVSFSSDRKSVKINQSNATPEVDTSVMERVKASFNQFIEKCKPGLSMGHGATAGMVR